MAAIVVDSATIYVHHAFVEPFPTLWACFRSIKAPQCTYCSNGYPLQADMDHLSLDMGHVLVQWLCSGTYQPRMQEMPPSPSQALKTAFGVYSVARQYELRGLETLAREEISLLGSKCSVSSFIDAAQQEYPKTIGRDHWLRECATSLMKSAIKNDLSLDTQEGTDDEAEGIPAASVILMSLLKVCREMIAEVANAKPTEAQGQESDTIDSEAVATPVDEPTDIARDESTPDIACDTDSKTTIATPVEEPEPEPEPVKEGEREAADMWGFGTATDPNHAKEPEPEPAAEPELEVKVEDDGWGIGPTTSKKHLKKKKGAASIPEPELEPEPTPELEPEKKDDGNLWGFSTSISKKYKKKKVATVDPEPEPELEPEPEPEPVEQEKKDDDEIWGFATTSPKKDKKKKVKKGAVVDPGPGPEPEPVKEEKKDDDDMWAFATTTSKKYRMKKKKGAAADLEPEPTPEAEPIPEVKETEPEPVVENEWAVTPKTKKKKAVSIGSWTDVVEESKTTENEEAHVSVVAEAEVQRDPWLFWGVTKSPRQSLS
ncbi:hypothetical protein B0T14DRAFT_494359 [Immersiella caudata]|uniref:BTB domain-containing protein n=1 Tax=Immersiella caudata TaxID=314043 RepID=A0AA39WW74_9PEZI|nr:hypothetical protein B0T14DRAFT_494359 [Immersiella caudata]